MAAGRMKISHLAILANAIIVLLKVPVAFSLFSLGGLGGILPVVGMILLVIACALLGQGRREGALLGAIVIAVFLLQFLVLGLALSAFGLFIVHVLAFVANLAALRARR